MMGTGWRPLGRELIRYQPKVVLLRPNTFPLSPWCVLTVSAISHKRWLHKAVSLDYCRLNEPLILCGTQIYLHKVEIMLQELLDCATDVLDAIEESIMPSVGESVYDTFLFTFDC